MEYIFVTFRRLFCGSSVAFPVSLVAAVRGSVWRFKPFCYAGRSGIPVKRFGVYMGKIKPLGGVFDGGILCGCLAFPVVPLCGVSGIIVRSPFPVLLSVAPSGMLEGGKAVPVVIGGGLWFSVRRLAVWRSVLAAGGWWLVAWSDLAPLPCRFFGDQVALSDRRSAAAQTFRRKISRQVFKNPFINSAL